MHKIKLDQADKQILNILQEDGRIRNAKLASELGMSPSPMLERVKKLEQAGIIRKYVALIAPEKVGKNTLAFVAVSLAVHQLGSLDAFKSEIEQLPEVLECYHISGPHDFLLKVLVDDMDEYREFVINKLTRIGSLNNIQTWFVLDTVKHETHIAVE